MAVVVRLHPSALQSTSRKEACRICVVHIDLGPARGHPPPRPWSRPLQDRAVSRVARGGPRAAAGAADACRRDALRPGRPPPHHRRPRRGSRAHRGGGSGLLRTTTTGAARPPLPHPHGCSPARSAGDPWARSRRSARALRVGVVAPALEAETTSWVQLPPGPLVAGRSGPVIGHQRFEPATGSHAHDRDDTPRLRAGACRLSHPYSDRCGFESRPGPRGPGSSTVEQLPVCTPDRSLDQDHPPAGRSGAVIRESARPGREVRVRVPPS